MATVIQHKIMTQDCFNFVKANFSKFDGKEVEFKYYIPSADKYATAKGILRKVGTGCNQYCFIIGSFGHNHAIFYGNVTILDDQNNSLITIINNN